MAKSKQDKKLKKAMSGATLTSKEQAKKSAPRNEIVRAMVEQRMFQSTAHKNKKTSSKRSVRGVVKHKTKNYGF